MGKRWPNRDFCTVIHMHAPETYEQSRPIVRTALYISAAIFLLPFIYLTSLALLLSACVQGWSIPSRSFLKAYAAPANAMAGAQGAMNIFSGDNDATSCAARKYFKNTLSDSAQAIIELGLCDFLRLRESASAR